MAHCGSKMGAGKHKGGARRMGAGRKKGGTHRLGAGRRKKGGVAKMGAGRKKGGGIFGSIVKLGKKELVSALKNPKNQKAALNAIIAHAPGSSKPLLRQASKLL